MFSDDDDDDFYDVPTAASKTKIEIVTKYFDAWSNILGQTAPRLAYQDLFSGPGRYKKLGTPSTPVLIVEKIISNPKLRTRVETFFNDANPEYAAALAGNLQALPGYETLKFKPEITNLTIDKGFEAQLRHIGRVPTFSFVDPFGYKGVTLRLLRMMLRGFGCDLILFFSFNRINAAIANDNVEDHMEGLFGAETLKELQKHLIGKTPAQRATIIVDRFAQELTKMGFHYVHPFTFMQPDRNRVSHHLIFVSKNQRGYQLIKDITDKASSSHEEGVPSYGFAKPVSKDATPLLFEFARPLAELGAVLMKEYAGQEIRFQNLYDEHNVGRPFVARNYRDILTELELAGKVVCEPPYTKRRRNKDKVSFGPKTVVKFPPGQS